MGKKNNTAFKVVTRARAHKGLTFASIHHFGERYDKSMQTLMDQAMSVYKLVYNVGTSSTLEMKFYLIL